MVKRNPNECLITGCRNKVYSYLTMRYSLLPEDVKKGSWLSVVLQHRFCKKHTKIVAEPIANILLNTPHVHAEVTTRE